MPRCPEPNCNGKMKQRQCQTCGFFAYRPPPNGSGYNARGCGDPWKGLLPERVEVTEVNLGEVLLGAGQA